MSRYQATESGVLHVRGTLAVTVGGPRPEEDWSGANEAKVDRLRLRTLQRQARAQGIQIRHADSGYALIDTARKCVHDRRDLTLDEIESWLEQA